MFGNHSLVSQAYFTVVDTYIGRPYNDENQLWRLVPNVEIEKIYFAED